MKIMVQFELTAQNEKSKEIQSFFGQILNDTREYNGCHGAKISKSQKHENKFILVEYWESQKHFDAYLNWRKEIGDFDTLGSMLTCAPEIQTFDVITNA